MSLSFYFTYLTLGFFLISQNSHTRHPSQSFSKYDLRFEIDSVVPTFSQKLLLFSLSIFLIVYVWPERTEPETFIKWKRPTLTVPFSVSSRPCLTPSGYYGKVPSTSTSIFIVSWCLTEIDIPSVSKHKIFPKRPSSYFLLSLHIR